MIKGQQEVILLMLLHFLHVTRIEVCHVLYKLIKMTVLQNLYFV
jgi:hypothetical protein